MRFVFALRTSQLDFVDINMGCPIDLVCDKGMGAALMSRRRKLKGIIAVRRIDTTPRQRPFVHAVCAITEL